MAYYLEVTSLAPCNQLVMVKHGTCFSINLWNILVMSSLKKREKRTGRNNSGEKPSLGVIKGTPFHWSRAGMRRSGDAQWFRS